MIHSCPTNNKTQLHHKTKNKLWWNKNNILITIQNNAFFVEWPFEVIQFWKDIFSFIFSSLLSCFCFLVSCLIWTTSVARIYSIFFHRFWGFLNVGTSRCKRTDKLRLEDCTYVFTYNEWIYHTNIKFDNEQTINQITLDLEQGESRRIYSVRIEKRCRNIIIQISTLMQNTNSNETVE